MIALIDYGMGNLRSVGKALEAMGGRVRVTDRARDVKRADKVVLPGVGEFGQAMDELKKRNLLDALRKSIAQSKPFLGICLGMQLLFESSEESPKTPGLRAIQGKVKRFPDKMRLKIPQMGWNQVEFLQRSALVKGVKNNSYFYFVHSYYVEPQNRGTMLGVTQYGKRFVSMVEKDHLFGMQFHPEKSQQDGLRLLRNFISL